MTRNPYLTDGMFRFLSAIRNSEDEYAIQERLDVYVDLERFSARTVMACLRLCLISEDSMPSHGTHIWLLNQDGREVLDDPNHVPRIVKALVKGGGSHGE